MNNNITQISDTAFMAAAYRALESAQPNALFQDPLAETLAGEQGRRIIENLPKRAFIGGWSVVIRTRIIDNLIQDAIEEGVDTILNLGAGLDTRPYRLQVPASLRWIEVDQPHVIEFKQAKLQAETPQCQLERIGLDLTDQDARQAMLDKVASESKRVLVLTEAVTPYLTEQAVADLGSDLRAQPSINYWLVDYFSPASYEYRRRSGLSQAMQKAPFLFEPADYFHFFSQVGWQSKEIRYFAVEAQRLGRPAPFPAISRFIMRILGLLASPAQRRAMQEYAGFVLFEPVQAS